MPTIPLFTDPAVPTASHNVRAPGGYEIWRFIAWDRTQSRLLIATFSDGDPNDQFYLSQYRLFLRHPTRTRPPVPREHARFGWSVRQGQRIEFDFASLHIAAEQFVASDDRCELRAANFASAIKSNASIELRIQTDPFNGVEVRIDEANRAMGRLKLKGNSTLFEGRGRLLHAFGTRPDEVRARDAIENIAVLGEREAGPFAIDYLSQ